MTYLSNRRISISNGAIKTNDQKTLFATRKFQYLCTRKQYNTHKK